MRIAALLYGRSPSRGLLRYKINFCFEKAENHRRIVRGGRDNGRVGYRSGISIFTAYSQSVGQFAEGGRTVGLAIGTNVSRFLLHTDSRPF